MPFLASGFSPMGGTARYFTAPAVHTYRTNDSLATVKADGYFDEIKGVPVAQDWIYVCTDVDTTPKFAFIFIESDGVVVGIGTLALVAAGGTGYTIGDIVNLPMTKAAANGLFVIRRTVVRVVSVGGGGVVTGVLFMDYGSFKTTSLGRVMGSDLNGVATEVVSATGTPSGTLTLNVLLQSLSVTTYPDDIIAI